MSRTNRKIPHWAKGDPELEDKFKRGKICSVIASDQPFEEAWSPEHKKKVKKIARRKRRQGKAPTNFKK